MWDVKRLWDLRIWVKSAKKCNRLPNKLQWGYIGITLCYCATPASWNTGLGFRGTELSPTFEIALVDQRHLTATSTHTSIALRHDVP